MTETVDHHLVTQRKPLEEVEPIWIIRWLLRLYFEWRGFACRSHCGPCDGKCYANIEYVGTFADKVEAYHAANQFGGAVKPIPFNGVLPAETVAYKAGDVPQSEASHWYRKGVALAHISLPLTSAQRLQEKLRATDPPIDSYYSNSL